MLSVYHYIVFKIIALLPFSSSNLLVLSSLINEILFFVGLFMARE